MEGFAELITTCWEIKKKYNLNDNGISHLLEEVEECYKTTGIQPDKRLIYRINTETSNTSPLEEKEQMKLAEYLDWKGYCWCHVPNGGNRDAVIGAKMKKQGVKPGVPDVMIFNLPEEGYTQCRGIAIELKRKKGGQLRENQKKWLDTFDILGWLTKVCYGADEAIEFLEKLFEEG